MNRIAIAQRILSVLDEIARMQNSLYALHMTDPAKYPENYEILSLDIALRSEGITCRLRNLVYETTPVKKAGYLAKAAREHNIQIEKQDGVLKILLPSLLPRKKQNQGKYLLDPLYYAFSGYTESHENSIFDECVVYIAHIYGKDVPKRRFRDYDNVETKQLIDAIAAFFLIDDSGRFIDVHNATELGETDCTAVYLIEKNVFPAWLETHLSTVQTISQNSKNEQKKCDTV